MFPKRLGFLEKPQSTQERHELLDRCGPQAFLQPDAKPHPKYPITCQLSCTGLRAAESRALETHHADLGAAASNMLLQNPACFALVQQKPNASKKRKRTRT